MAKRCTKCLQWKEADEFFKDRSSPDGLHTVCKACQERYKADYQARKAARERQELRRTHIDELPLDFDDD